MALAGRCAKNHKFATMFWPSKIAPANLVTIATEFINKGWNAILRHSIQHLEMRTQSLLSFFFAAISLTLPAFGAKNANRKERPEKPAEKLPSASHRNASSKKTQPPTVQGTLFLITTL